MTYAIRSQDTGAWYEKTKIYADGQRVDYYQPGISRAMVFRKRKDAEKRCAELYKSEVIPVRVSRSTGLATKIDTGAKAGRRENHDDQHGGPRAGKAPAEA